MDRHQINNPPGHKWGQEAWGTWCMYWAKHQLVVIKPRWGCHFRHCRTSITFSINKPCSSWILQSSFQCLLLKKFSSMFIVKEKWQKIHFGIIKRAEFKSTFEAEWHWCSSWHKRDRKVKCHQFRIGYNGKTIMNLSHYRCDGSF